MGSQGAGGGGGGQDDKDTYTLLWLLMGIFVVGGLIWYFLDVYLKQAFIALRKFEVLAISYFVDNSDIQTAIQGVNMATPDNISMHWAEHISLFVGQYLVYPVGIILVIMAIVMFRGHATMRFTKAYSMDTLANQEKENWPQISPVVALNLIDEDINQGPWAMSMNPMQFAKHYQLLKVELVPDRKAAWRAEGIPKATVLRENATQVFAGQLGPLWSGVHNLPPHAKAMYALFLARIEHDTDATRAYLSKLSKAAAKGTMDYSDTEEYIKKYGKSKAALLCHKKHAYVLTVMASMLQLARVDGVLATADFLWLKPVDRRLWYTLNCVGRQVAVPEVAGVQAHWLAEKEMGRPLSVPMVDEAVNALEKGIANMMYIPADGEEVPESSAG